MNEYIGFELLQVAVGNRKSLSVAINDSDWRMLFDFCKRQALIGVGFTAVEKLHAVGVVCPANLRMQWMALALQIEKRNVLLNEQCRKLTEQYGHDGLSTCILKGQGNCLNYPEELRNRRQCGDIDVWTTLMKDERLRIIHTLSIKRGVHQATQVHDYLHTEYRERHGCPQADDLREQQLSAIGQQLKEKNIDPQIAQMDTNGCPQADNGIAIAVQMGKEEVEYVEYQGRKAVIEYVKMQHRLVGNNEKPVIRYHHIEAPKMEGTEVEVHFRPCYTHSPLRNWRMQRWFENHADVCMKNKTQMGFAVPTSSVNVVYQMCHLFSHYFDEGLGLRQLMDYYFALRVWHNDVMECKDLQSQGMWSEGLGTSVMSAPEVMAVLRSFGMGKFAAAVMWVINEVFGGGNENDNENEKSPQMNTDGHGCPQADGRSEHEFTRIIREFKEIGPQADGGGEQQLPAIGQQLKEIGPQADEVGEQQVSDTAKLMSTYEISNERIIGQQLKKNNCVPWMICEPNEFEGKRLLVEIMQGGNFGQYDTRDAGLKKGGMIKHGLWKLKRVMRLVSSYPEEALWEPVFRVYHLLWRWING